MNTSRLRELRAGRRVPLETLSKVIGKSKVSYIKKELGETPFKPDEVIALSKFYGLSYDEMNAIFYDSNLPIGNFEDYNRFLRALESTRSSVTEKE